MRGKLTNLRNLANGKVILPTLTENLPPAVHQDGYIKPEITTTALQYHIQGFNILLDKLRGPIISKKYSTSAACMVS